MKKFFSLQYWKGQRLLLLAFLLVHTVLVLLYVQQQPLTNDEADYIEYSKRWLKGEPLKIKDVDDSKTPLTAVAWLPRIAKQFADPNFKLTDWGRSDQVAGRYMMIIFFWGVFIYVFWWARSLFSNKGWVFPIVLLVIDPLFMAFTPVVTSDVACAFVLLASMYHFYRYFQTKKLKQFVITAVFTGIALVTKSSLVFIPFIFVCIYLSRLIAGYNRFRLGVMKQAVFFVLICWLVVNLGYYFHHSFITWREIDFKSTFFQSLLSSFSFLKPLPTLLPEPFIQGFDQLQYHKEVGPFLPDFPFKGVFILNEKHPTGVWYYYLATGFFKLPIGFIVLLLWSIILFFRKFRSGSFFSTYVFLLTPLLLYSFVLSFMNPFQQGLRHALILFPFLFIGMGYLWNYYKNKQKGKLIICFLLMFHIVSVARWWPDIMHYTNEFICKKENTFKYLAEFNYKHGEIARDVAPFLKQHPEYSIAPTHPAKGKFIVPGALLYNITYESQPKYAWLKQYKPVGIYRLVFLLYEIK